MRSASSRLTNPFSTSRRTAAGSRCRGSPMPPPPASSSSSRSPGFNSWRLLGCTGRPLALVHALGGHPVRLYDHDPGALARAPGLMRTALATIVEAGEAPPGWTEERLAAAVRIVPDLAQAAEGAWLVVEAVAEDRR